MPRPKSAPRSLSERKERKSKARTLRSQAQSDLFSSSEEEEDASQRNRRGASSASSQSSGTQNRSRSVETPRPTSTQSQSQRSQQTDEPRASRSAARQHTPSSTSDEEEEDEEEHDPSQRNRRSRSSTRTPSEPVASTSQHRSVSAGPPGGGSTSQNVRPNRKPRIAPLLKEMLRLQLSWHHLIPKASFGRLVRELFDHRYRITPQALEALHEATEVFLVQLFEDAYKCCLHRARVTLAPKDIELVIILRRGIK
uniref:Histone domain-containing protein n=1 Tax=Anopheles coluzzii TaxID=1518534 RepID=A0A6E8VT15_ANOCL